KRPVDAVQQYRTKTLGASVDPFRADQRRKLTWKTKPGSLVASDAVAVDFLSVVHPPVDPSDIGSGFIVASENRTGSGRVTVGNVNLISKPGAIREKRAELGTTEHENDSADNED